MVIYKLVENKILVIKRSKRGLGMNIVLISENKTKYRVSQKTPKTIENDLLLEFQCLALN